MRAATPRPAILTLLATLLIWAASLAVARDVVVMGPFGMIVTDLLEGSFGEEIPCEVDPSYLDTFCFRVDVGTAQAVIARFAEVVGRYEAAKLDPVEWVETNGVWTASLQFANARHGALEIYLVEKFERGVVGMMRLVSPH